jgi:hypothetical protein
MKRSHRLIYKYYVKMGANLLFYLAFLFAKTHVLI